MSKRKRSDDEEKKSEPCFDEEKKSDTNTAISSAKTPLSTITENQNESAGISDPHANDVLCGRGDRINRHPGNQYFRKLVEEQKQDYSASQFRREKPMIAASIVSAIRNLDPPGRFLSKDAKKRLWYEIGDERAREKTCQALREKNRTNQKGGNESDPEAGGYYSPVSPMYNYMHSHHPPPYYAHGSHWCYPNYYPYGHPSHHQSHPASFPEQQQHYFSMPYSYPPYHYPPPPYQTYYPSNASKPDPRASGYESRSIPDACKLPADDLQKSKYPQECPSKKWKLDPIANRKYEHDANNPSHAMPHSQQAAYHRVQRSPGSYQIPVEDAKSLGQN